jgi:CubicO group peptidase (beta-lactamase class C family)
MKRILAMMMMVAMVVAGCGGGADTPSTRPAAANRCDPALRAWADAGFSGSISVSTRGKLGCSGAYGRANQAAGKPNTAATVFSIGSISKAFTAAAVLDLADAGKLSLADRAGKLIPELRGPAADATVEQLLLHTSGLTGLHGSDHEPLGRDEALAAIGRLERAFEPGSDFLYSNAGYTLLALIVERTSACATASTWRHGSCGCRAATSPAGSGTASRARRDPAPSATSRMDRPTRWVRSRDRTGPSTATATWR